MEGTSTSFCHIYFTKLLQSVNAKIGKAPKIMCSKINICSS